MLFPVEISPEKPPPCPPRASSRGLFSLIRVFRSFYPFSLGICYSNIMFFMFLIWDRLFCVDFSPCDFNQQDTLMVSSCSRKLHDFMLWQSNIPYAHGFLFSHLLWDIYKVIFCFFLWCYYFKLFSTLFIHFPIFLWKTLLHLDSEVSNSEHKWEFFSISSIV